MSTMRARSLVLVTSALVVALVVSVVGDLRAQMQPAYALTGKVSSAAEGPMEGVLVTAKAAGSMIAVTVVSDADGHYGFPASRLAPGTYTLSTRAVGYDLAGPTSAVLTAGKPVLTDLRLRKTKDLESQLTNAEILESIPGTYEQKQGLLDCVDCHTLHRVIDSTHNAADLLAVTLPRMENYANMSFPLHPQPYPHARTGRGGFVTPEFAAFVASINMSGGKRTWAFKTFPRLKGASTHIIITEYDLPRKTIEPHDVITTPDGMAWWSDFGEQYLGMLDPKTGKTTEFPLPELKPGYITGTLQLDQDPAGYLWMAMMYQGGIAKFDRTTKTFTEYKVAPADHPEFTQESMVMPLHDNVDGVVWTNNQDDHSFRLLHTADGSWTTLGPFQYPNSKQDFRSYGLETDAQNNAWLFDFGHSAIGKVDGKTGAFEAIQTPTPHSRPRRGRVDDATGLFWFAEYGANRIGMYDTKLDNGTIKEFELPTPWGSPYDVQPDKLGRIWTGSMLTDRISRLDPTTGTFLEFQLPKNTNIRRVWIDESTNPVTFWTGSNHGASIVKLEMLN
jgi:streptogramin lyase